MKEQYVKDLEVGTIVDDYFAINSKSAPRKYNTKNGLWFSFDISDKTGIIPIKFWGGPDEQSVVDVFSSFKVNDVVKIKGGNVKMDNYSNKLEIHLNQESVEISKITEFDYAEFVPTIDKDISELVSKFKSVIEEIQNNHIKHLLKLFFDDEEFMKKYANCPAAKSHHHNYVGGLIHHVLSMINLSKTLAKEYEPELDIDLMVAGCILHDIGKIEEYEVKAVIDYTIAGSLLGHIPIGAKMVEDKIDTLDDFPVKIKNKILHLILSHHGSQEAGSPVIPHFPEAVALHKIDDCDAQVKNSIQVKKKLQETTNDEIVKTGRDFGFMYLK